MASSYFKLKMLANKRTKKFPSKLSDEKQVIKILNESLSSNKCRICLKQGSIPIYGGDSFTLNLPDAIQTFGGVNIVENDDFPKHLCDECYSLLKGAVLFRKSARESDEILRRSSIESDAAFTNDHITDSGIFEECNDSVDAPDEEAIKLKPKDSKVQKYRKKHKNVRIQCQICYRLLTSQLYDKHLQRHQSASHLVCDICGKLYRKDNLIRHLQLHNNDLPFQCQICPYRGRFIESLKIHMRTHSGDKPFSCDRCELRFITKSNLNRHLLTHKKEKPFNCAECSRGFYTRRDLDMHLRADHTGHKEFGCRLCGNKYGTKKALMRHELRVHKREKLAKGRVPLYLQAEFRNNEVM